MKNKTIIILILNCFSGSPSISSFLKEMVRQDKTLIEILLYYKFYYFWQIVLNIETRYLLYAIVSITILSNSIWELPLYLYLLKRFRHVIIMYEFYNNRERESLVLIVNVILWDMVNKLITSCNETNSKFRLRARHILLHTKIYLLF